MVQIIYDLHVADGIHPIPIDANELQGLSGEELLGKSALKIVESLKHSNIISNGILRYQDDRESLVLF